MSDQLAAAINDMLGPQPPAKMGVAVSGGGDSIALLSVMADVAKSRDIELLAITVDHGLRPGTVSEVKLVTGLCQSLNLSHHVEYWTGWDGSGNLQARAREGRYELMADWAYANQISHIALGHTADDQAETVLMRLSRMAGVDGLSGMSAKRIRHGITWVRPFLNIRRATLRTYLDQKGLRWAEDPSNDDTRFDRVRARQALGVLEDLGIGVDTLVQTAQQMSQARDALDWQTFLAAQALVQIHCGAVALDLQQFRTQPAEIRRRLLVHSLMWLSGHDYPPRRDAVLGALEAIQAEQGFTLDGCQITSGKGLAWVHRELNALTDVVAEVGDSWDDRWTVTGPEDAPEIEVRALGAEILPSLEGWRDAGLPRAAIAVTPGVWYEDRLIAAPIAKPDDQWQAELDGGADAYFAALLSH